MNPNQLIFAALALVMLSACSSNNSNNVQDELEAQLTEEAMADKPEVDENLEKVKEIYYSLPSPLETSQLLKMSGAHFKYDALHTINDVKNYTTSKAKAINLGIYIADLSYCNVFHQQQHCVDYFAVTKNLGDDLGMGQVFSADIVDRINNNLSNQDSVYFILSELYWQANDALQKSDMKAINGMVAAGLWVEGMHIAIESIESANESKEMLTQRIAEQRYIINELVPMIASMNENGSLDDIVSDMKAIQQTFNNLKGTTAEATLEENTDGPDVIGGEQSVSISNDELKTLADQIASLRSKFTTMS